ncbi:hypothetical protein BJ508DRAFT_340250 [Ascobolus immersus RN42]|uniref:Uncharacterized protein n=1 Tax=Ascobolus immersus RN42 TaxID=1160509 RepID=A0A3N4HXC6_ASCIM|nr:hypothetical protein BJ508DRAFT_340250 [Ascobolus immersus RN42]
MGDRRRKSLGTSTTGKRLLPSDLMETDLLPTPKRRNLPLNDTTNTNLTVAPKQGQHKSTFIPPFSQYTSPIVKVFLYDPEVDDAEMASPVTGSEANTAGVTEGNSMVAAEDNERGGDSSSREVDTATTQRDSRSRRIVADSDARRRKKPFLLHRAALERVSEFFSRRLKSRDAPRQAENSDATRSKKKTLAPESCEAKIPQIKRESNMTDGDKSESLGHREVQAKDADAIYIPSRFVPSIAAFQAFVDFAYTGCYTYIYSPRCRSEAAVSYAEVYRLAKFLHSLVLQHRALWFLYITLLEHQVEAGSTARIVELLYDDVGCPDGRPYPQIVDVLACSSHFLTGPQMGRHHTDWSCRQKARWNLHDGSSASMSCLTCPECKQKLQYTT